MKGSSLPVGYILGVLSREQAAEYVGVSASLFDQMVAHGRMPLGIVLSERRYGWIQRELDVAIAALPRKDHIGTVAPVATNDEDRQALERFDAARKAAKAQKPVAQH